VEPGIFVPKAIPVAVLVLEALVVVALDSEILVAITLPTEKKALVLKALETSRVSETALHLMTSLLVIITLSDPTVEVSVLVVVVGDLAVIETQIVAVEAIADVAVEEVFLIITSILTYNIYLFRSCDLL
jgi:hypothetical protein